MKAWIVCSVAGLAFAANASAATFSFGNITNNTTFGGGQLRVDVGPGTFDGFNNHVIFHFYHSGSIPMAICDVYFDDGTLLALGTNFGTSGPQVNFHAPATPGNLPGANAVDFQTHVATSGAHWSADSDSPVYDNGVSPGETLDVDFSLLGTLTYLDTIAALTQGYINPTTRGLRIGFHVQGIQPSGQSDSFVNGNVPVLIPLPVGSYLGFAGLAGVGALGFVRRRHLARV